jgi:DNA-binding NarL/FixJ family response regulator
METIRLLVVDDHALFRRALANLLGNEPGFEVVGEAGDGAEAVSKAQALRPDLILMDIHMPGTDGLEATRQIVRALPATRVVILTVSEEDKDLFEAIKSGAHGYLLKTVEPEGLCALLRGVFRGEAPLSRATAAKILKQFARPEASAPGAAGGEDLTAREKEVLAHVASGLTNKEIGSKLAIAENTVKNHLKSILAKLHLDNRVQAAALAIQRGLVRDGKPDKKSSG